MRVWILLLLVGLVSCSDNTPAGSGCRDNSGCEGGEVCVAGECLVLCVIDDDCAAGEICTEGTCVLGVRTDLPAIDAVDGSGSADLGPVDPRGTRADHHLRQSIDILGQNLEGSAVALLPDGGSLVTLAVTSSLPSRITATLPAGVASGLHLLTVTNDVGSDQAEVWLLQGEKGDPGDPQTASGVLLLLQSLGDPVPGLNATFATTATTATQASAVLDGAGVARPFGDLAVPVGSILPFAGDPATLPADWVVCDGSTIDSPHAALLDYDSGTAGVQVPSLTDNRFLMGVASGAAGTLGGRNDIPTGGAHTHSFGQDSVDRAPDASHFVDGSYTNSAGDHDHAAENRPRFMGVLFIIRIN